MSDARDAVAEALALNKRLAASLLLRKQELEARLAGGPDEALALELARVDADYKNALAEVAALRKLGATAADGEARAVVLGALGGDPVLQSHEERALAGAREHLAELEAQAALGDELGGIDDDAVTPIPGQLPTRPVARPPSREEADAQARAEFEALRARRGLAPAPAPAADGSGSGSDGDAAASPPPRPKKTL